MKSVILRAACCQKKRSHCYRFFFLSQPITAINFDNCFQTINPFAAAISRFASKLEEEGIVSEIGEVLNELFELNENMAHDLCASVKLSDKKER